MTWEILLNLMCLMKNKLELDLFKKDGLVCSKNIGHCLYTGQCTQKHACCIFFKTMLTID